MHNPTCLQTLRLLQRTLSYLTSTSTLGIDPTQKWSLILDEAQKLFLGAPGEYQTEVIKSFLSQLPWSPQWDERGNHFMQVVLDVTQPEERYLAIVFSALSLRFDDSYSTSFRLSPHSNLLINIDYDVDGWNEVPANAVHIDGTRSQNSNTARLVTLTLESVQHSKATHKATSVQQIDHAIAATVPANDIGIGGDIEF